MLEAGAKPVLLERPRDTHADVLRPWEAIVHDFSPLAAGSPPAHVVFLAEIPLRCRLEQDLRAGKNGNELEARS
ncbi:MAG: hypothetical protein ACE5LB_12755, partial [Acidiferrobacterales bacterium]